ncbi:MAG: hypothetical protein ACJ74Z_01170, partial [Bryobacteraceae bacterium]
IEADDFPRVISKLERYGGRTTLLSSAKDYAVFALSSGISLRVQLAGKRDWGVALVACTGSKAHLRKLTAVTGSLKTLRLNGRFPSESKADPPLAAVDCSEIYLRITARWVAVNVSIRPFVEDYRSESSG